MDDIELHSRRTWASAEIFPGGGDVDILLIFSGCWWCNANGLSQNTLRFLAGP